MKGSIIIVGFFLLGIAIGKVNWMPFLLDQNFSHYALWLLMALVGLSVGADEKAFTALKNIRPKVLWVPAATVTGTLLGVALISLLIPHRTLSECLAVGSGFGYYSLSSIFITQYKGAELGVVALLANILREVATLLLAPAMVKYMGKLAPICAGGATTMDTTLPVITKYSGKEFVLIALIHGLLIDFSVPFLVTLFCR